MNSATGPRQFSQSPPPADPITALPSFMSNSHLDGAEGSRPNTAQTLHTQTSQPQLPLRGKNSSSTRRDRLRESDAGSEAAALAQYLNEQELNLSMSTFTTVGHTLALSNVLRVLSLKGSTIDSYGLAGLADVPTLQSICVSHMRNLKSLKPLITATTPGRRCMLSEIDAQFTPLTNDGIVGLENLPVLRRLDLSMTRVTDVSCLAKSSSLTALVLAGTQVTSNGITGLEKIATLSELNISRTKVSTLAQLAKSPSLEILLLYSCKVTDEDIRGLEKMPRLAHLDISTTKVTDLSVFRVSPSLKLIKAQWLALKNCFDIIQERRAQMDRLNVSESSMAWKDQEAGYEGLSEVRTLETIDLSFNTIRSVQSLCRSRSLKHLILRRTRIDNNGIAGLQKLANTLETLVVTNLTDNMNEASDESTTTTSTNGLLQNVPEVARLLHLTQLDLSYTDVFDLRMLQNLPKLKELVIVETLVTVEGLRGIEKIPTLEVLDLSQTSVLSLQFLAGGCPTLKKILVKSNRNSRGFRVGHIESITSLETLDISDTVVEDTRTMWNATWRLKELIWRWGERREATGAVEALACWVNTERLTGIDKLPSLEVLDITNSFVKDLRFLEKAVQLKSLFLRGCRLLDDEAIRALRTHERLEVLDLCNNIRITDVSCLASCRNLRELLVGSTGVTAQGLEGLESLTQLKVLDIANTKAEEALMEDAGGYTDSTPNSGARGAGSEEQQRKQRQQNATRRRGQSPAAGGGGGAAGGGQQNYRLDESGLRDTSQVMEASVTPAQYRVPRRRRVSFVADHATLAPPPAPPSAPQSPPS